MINIGLISDTHGVIKDEWMDYFGRCDYLIHAGDLDNDDVFEWFTSLKTPTYIVQGNCDHGIYADFLPDHMNIPIGGKMFLAIHNKMYLPYNLEDIDFVIHGHTHFPEDIVQNGVRFINPGTAGRNRGAGCTMAILHLDGVKDELEYIRL